MGEKKHLGTSAFTHQDDANAEMHTTTIHGKESLLYGEPMPPKHQLEEIVLGPAPFGSPDPRTLGHRMQPLSDGSEPASAAPLDEDWVKRNRLAGTTSEEELDDLTKDELKSRADALEIEYSSGDTKDDLKQAILDHQSGKNTEDDDEDDDSDDDDDEDKTENFNSKNKAELLELAKERNVAVDESNSKAEIVEALEKASSNG